MRADPVLGAIVKRKGACGLAERATEPRFRSLLRALVSQQNVYGLRRRPSEKQVLRMGERWKPYRSIASWYLWAALDNE